MKKLIILITLVACVAVIKAQDVADSKQLAIKWAPTGLALGSLSLHGEYNFGKNSLTAKIGLPVSVNHTFTYEDKDADFQMKATSFLAGYRMYISKKHMRGFYFEPFFKYVHQNAEGVGNGTLSGEPVVMDFTNDYNALGVGAQLGVQFLVGKRFVIDLFLLGPEINSARNTFKAVEASNSIPWTSIQASEAEKDIRDFIDKFPFIRNHVDVMVDKTNRTVITDFKGALPGFRTGVSFGIAF
jgi:hypothetical protein